MNCSPVMAYQINDPTDYGCRNITNNITDD